MADLKKKYVEVSEQLKEKENTLRILVNGRELITDEINTKYIEHKEILDGFLRDVQDRKETNIKSLILRVENIEKLDSTIGGLIDSRKTQKEQISEAEEKVILLKQIKANIIRDMDYPDGLMKDLLKELYIVKPKFALIQYGSLNRIHLKTKLSQSSQNKDKKKLKDKYKIVQKYLKILEAKRSALVNERDTASKEINELYESNGKKFQDLMGLIENNQKDNPIDLIKLVEQLDKNDQSFGLLFSEFERMETEISVLDAKITKLRELKGQILGHLSYDDKLFDDLMQELTMNVRYLKKGLYKINKAN